MFAIQIVLPWLKDERSNMTFVVEIPLLLIDELGLASDLHNILGYLARPTGLMTDWF